MSAIRRHAQRAAGESMTRNRTGQGDLGSMAVASRPWRVCRIPAQEAPVNSPTRHLPGVASWRADGIAIPQAPSPPRFRREDRGDTVMALRKRGGLGESERAGRLPALQPLTFSPHDAVGELASTRSESNTTTRSADLIDSETMVRVDGRLVFSKSGCRPPTVDPREAMLSRRVLWRLDECWSKAKSRETRVES